MKNRMKEKLLAGEPVFGVSVMFPSPQVVEMIGGLGFDWVLIDCEHGSISPEGVELMAMAAELGLTVDLDLDPSCRALATDSALFSETNSRFLVTVGSEVAGEFEASMGGVHAVRVGEVRP